MADFPLCRHCRTRPTNRCRGLCNVCYYTPGVRDLYPADHRYRLSPDFFGGYALATPTAARPGTPEKMEAMAERVRLKKAVFNPADGQASD